MAKLVSVNVGLPKDVAWQGRTVYTGAWKDPVTGSRMVRRLNIDGDGQGDLGGHGGENRAVLVYQLESYRHWADELGCDELAPGTLGENFTVDGLPDDEVCIGDRYQIGQAVLEVTQPRVTCYRAGMRIGVPRMAALLVAHRRPGFYCRVLTEGEVEAGQDIIKIAAGPEQVTVADIDALLYLPGHSREALDRALRIPALSPGWQTSLRSLAAQAQEPSAVGNAGLTAAASSPPPAWTGFRPLEVTAVRSESRQVRSVTLADPDGIGLPGWLAGQSIAVRLHVEGGGALVRSYSLSNRAGSGEFRISVKREEHGAASTYIHSRLKPGDRVDVAAPRGSFFLTEGEAPVLLLSVGVGVTPVLAMLHSLAGSQPEREVWWVHGARDGAEHTFKSEAERLLSQLPHSRSHVFYSRAAASDRRGTDFAEDGRVSVATLDHLDVPRDADAYLCGPAEFMAELGAGLVAHGLDPARVHTELFGAAPALTPGIVATPIRPHLPAGPPGPGPEVHFARSGLAAPWGPPNTSLLEFAESCDVATRWSCRTGVCHNCETPLLSGAVRHDPEPLDPPADGNILICCAQPTEDIVLDL